MTAELLSQLLNRMQSIKYSRLALVAGIGLLFQDGGRIVRSACVEQEETVQQSRARLAVRSANARLGLRSEANWITFRLPKAAAY